MVCGQLLQMLEGSSGGSKDFLDPSAGIPDPHQLHAGSGMHGYPPMPMGGQMGGAPDVRMHNRPPVKFYCSVCPKGFRSKLDVERHMRTHTGEKPFQCPYCPHRSATKGNLKAHMRHIHVDARMPF